MLDGYLLEGMIDVRDVVGVLCRLAGFIFFRRIGMGSGLIAIVATDGVCRAFGLRRAVAGSR